MQEEKVTVGHYMSLKAREMILFNGLQSVLTTNNAKLVLPAAKQLSEIRKEIKDIESMVLNIKKTAVA